MAAYCTIRIETLATWQAVHHSGLHARRQDEWMPHVDPARTHLNEVAIGSLDVSADVRAMHESCGAVERRGAKPCKAVDILISTSPEYFRPNGEPAGAWCQERYEAFRERVVRFCRRWFAGMIAHLRFDLDEETPHAHALIVPVNRWLTRSGKEKAEISYRSVFQKGLGPRSFSVWQDRLADECADIGLERGRRGSETPHVRPKRWQIGHWVELLGLRAEVARLSGEVKRLKAEKDERSRVELARQELAQEKVRQEEAREQQIAAAVAGLGFAGGRKIAAAACDRQREKGGGAA